MITLHRIALPGVNAALITGILLYSMYLLIDIQEPLTVLSKQQIEIEWLHVLEDDPVITTITKPKKLPDVLKAPELLIDDPKIDILVVDDSSLFPDLNQNNENTTLINLSDSQLVLAMAYPPNYPNSILQRGVEGYVVVGFSVSSSGSVFEAFIIESEPKGVFDRSALKAIQKFKYKPQMVNDKPISTDGQRYMFTYKIDQ